MLTKNELKYYSMLLSKKHRKSEGKFLIEGKRLVAEGLESSYEPEVLFMTNSFVENNSDYIESFKGIRPRIEVIASRDFDKIVDTQNSQGIAAAFKMPKCKTIESCSADIIVALENIADPGNVGTILRNCDWFGIRQVVLSENCADLYNPKVLRSGMGAIFHIEVFESNNFISSLYELKNNGYRITCADMQGDNVFRVKPAEKTVIVLCNEAFGPSAQLRDVSDSYITIPRIGRAESLNVANASAVILAEFTSH